MVQPEIELLIDHLNGHQVDVLALPCTVVDGLRVAMQEFKSHWRPKP